MKKLGLAASFLILLFLTSCRDIINSLDLIPPFNVPYTTSVDLPLATVNTESYTRTPEIPMNVDLDAKIKEQRADFGINNVKSVRINSLDLEYISSAMGVKMDAIKNLRILIKAPNVPEKVIAFSENNSNPDKIILTVPNEELLNYFKTNQNSLILEIQGNFVATDVVKVKMNSVFRIEAKL